MVVDIRTSLHRAEEDLILSFGEGLAALEAFGSSWSALLETLKSQTLDPETSALAYATAAREEVLATSFMELQARTDTIINEAINDFNTLSLSDPIEAPLPPSRPTTQPLTPSSESTPPYIASAYKWLLKNIHNPYPTKETKLLIMQATGASLTNIDAWFLNARRRIGWSTISRKYFGGSKTDTAAAAFRALSKEAPRLSDGEEQTPLPANIWVAFVEMEDVAKQLYSEKFTTSKLAGRLDTTVKDMTDNDRERRRQARKQEKAVEEQKEECEREQQRKRDAQRRWKEAEEGFPSSSPEPESFIQRFESPASAESENEDLMPPPPIAARKRAPSEDVADEGTNERPAKRSRILSSSSSCSSVDSTFSVSERVETSPSSPSSTCSTPPPSTPTDNPAAPLPRTSTTSQRKRRLSDADGEPPKRPMPLKKPRLQVVSDPLPKSIASGSPSDSSSPVDESTILSWYQQFLEAPSTAVVDGLDISGPIEWNMFDYSQFTDYASSGETSEGADWEGHDGLNGEDPLPLSLSASPAIHIPSLAFPNFDLPPVSVNSDRELDFCSPVGWSYGGGLSKKAILPTLTYESADLNALDGLSPLISLPPNQNPPEQPELSDQSAFDPLGAFDWSSIIPQTIPAALPAAPTPFNTSIIASATINPTAYLTSSAESRTEKLRKYQEHIAKARQLQAELAFA
ncbi:hypothetical protein BDN71DRAFT_1500521 [Pleurotus eryngii]|uniref:Homeodomain 1 mating type protein n=1 Tax=Pleurotus eryngii TaxID=5323 RepID=A0A9P6ACP5_PLEER|nr:hypothetical protein BDN71DRAFT_1500521 [Pleurotus eryngii]